MLQTLVAGTLLLLLLAYGSAAVAHPLADRTLPRQGPALRWLAVAAFAAGYLTLLFHVLIAFSAFDRANVAIVLGAGIAAVRVAGFSHRSLADSLRRDVGALLRLAAAGRFTPLRLVYALAAVFAAVTAGRALVLPTVAWDSITYHFVKAGMWVQSGGPITLAAPGGWSMYRSLFGGGEIFTAFAMLPFSNDLLACGVDLGWWALLGMASYAFARELGLRVRHRCAAMLYLLFLPAIWDAVGWGYVDLPHGALLLTGLVFSFRYLRVGHPPLLLPALIALGLAVGVKLTSAPFVAAAGAVLLGSAARAEAERGRRLRYALAGGLAGSLCVAPWIVRSLLDTGYPTGIPITIAGLRLGPDNPTFAWYQVRDVVPYTFAVEWAALARLFPLPLVRAPHLSALSLVPLVLAPLGFAAAFRRRDLRGGLLMVLCLVVATLAFFYTPTFSFSRLEFTWDNGRFLAPIVLVCVPLAFAAFPARSRGRDLLGSYLVLATAAHIASWAPEGLTRPAFGIVALGAGAVIVSVAILAAARRLPARSARVVAPALVVALVLGLSSLRSIERRYELLANREDVADFFRYWWVAARILEQEPAPVRLAVTSGAHQDADNWLMYYFLGRNLQNTLHYVPISKDGGMLPFGEDSPRERDGDANAWIARLHAMQITHVMSFYPTSIELRWMSERPDRFEWVTGFQDHWALFRVGSR